MLFRSCNQNLQGQLCGRGKSSDRRRNRQSLVRITTNFMQFQMYIKYEKQCSPWLTSFLDQTDKKSPEIFQLHNSRMVDFNLKLYRQRNPDAFEQLSNFEHHSANRKKGFDLDKSPHTECSENIARFEG